MAFVYSGNYEVTDPAMEQPSLQQTFCQRFRRRLGAAGPPRIWRTNSFIENPVHFLHRIDWLFICAFLGIVACCTFFYNNHTPEVRSSKHLKHFSEDRVNNFLDHITRDQLVDLSLYLDKLYLINSITEKTYANDYEFYIYGHEACIDIDVQCFMHSGTVIAKIGPKMALKPKTILISCEFSLDKSEFEKDDTDAVPCAILLDVLQSIVFNNSTFENNVLFMFNLSGRNYSSSALKYVLNKYNVDAVVKLSGKGGREVLLPYNNNALHYLFLSTATHHPSSVVIQELLQSKASLEKIIDLTLNETDEPNRITGLDIVYLPDYHVASRKRFSRGSGVIQRSGDNLLSFVYRLAVLRSLDDKSLSIFGNKLVNQGDCYGFPYLTFSTYSFWDLFNRNAALAVLAIFALIAAFTWFAFLVISTWMCHQSVIHMAKLFGGGIGCMILFNTVLYFVINVLNYIPFIEWNAWKVFVRNFFLHFFLTMSMCFKLTENIEAKFRTDYEHLYMSYFLFSPLVMFAIGMEFFYSTRWGYYLFVIVLPIVFSTPLIRQFIIGFGNTYGCPRLVMILHLLSILPGTWLIIQTVLEVWKTQFSGFSDFPPYIAAVLAFSLSLILSNLTIISQDIIFDWDGSKYVPINDCSWMKVETPPRPPPQQTEEESERYFTYKLEF